MALRVFSHVDHQAYRSGATALSTHISIASKLGRRKLEQHSARSGKGLPTEFEQLRVRFVADFF